MITCLLTFMPTMQAVIFLFLSEELEVLEGEMPSKQEKMVLGCFSSDRTDGKLGAGGKASGFIQH